MCRKVGLLKRRVQSHLARWEMKNCTPLWREAHFNAKLHKTPHVWITFGSWDVKKVHAVVARSAFPSQNVQSTPGPDHFWKLRCRKSARRCGAKHIALQSQKCKKLTGSELLDVQMSFCVAGTRDSARCQKWAKRDGFVVPHKAVAEVSRIGHYRRGGLLRCMDGRANPLVNWKVAGLCWTCVFWSACHGCSGHLTTTAGCSVV